jgi:opacity protein-like surface antigen
MSKKMMLLALAVVSAAFFALPAIASAQEIHLEPGNGETFNVSGGAGELRAESEPTITCETTDGSGKFDVGSSTTGTSTLDFTGCHTTVFGITAKCRSEASALDNTIASGGTFHLITWKNGSGTAFPAVLLTTNITKIVCAGITSITTTGNVIGTITSPACGASSKEVKLSFTATSTTQNHLAYTGVNQELKAYTGTNPENEKKSSLVGAATNTSTNAQKLNCT